MSAAAVSGGPRRFEGWGAFIGLGAAVGAILLLVQALYPPTDAEIFDALRSEPFSQQLPGLRFDHTNATDGRGEELGFVQLSFDSTEIDDPKGRGVVLLSYDPFETATEAQEVIDSLRGLALREISRNDPFPQAEPLDVPVAHLGDDGFCIRNVVDYCAVRVGRMVVYADSEYRFQGLGDDHRLEDLTRAAVAHLEAVI